MMRRRPLARAAVVGGAAYYAGKKRTESRAADEAQDQQIADLQDKQAQPQHATPPAVGSDDMVEQLTNLKSLLDQGILTQAEFDTQKQKVLAGA